MWIVDRFEGEYAVIECDDITFSIPKKALPENIKEGDIIKTEIDPQKTQSQKEKAHSLMNKLFGKDSQH